MRSKGFTMIELMIVIVIIGILGTMAANTYIKSLARGRDAQRIQDMKEIQKGFEMYYAKHNDAYGATYGAMFSDGEVFPGGEIKNKQTELSYSYPVVSSTSYCACAPMESKDKVGNYIYANSDAACNFNASIANKRSYCVVNSQ